MDVSTLGLKIEGIENIDQAAASLGRFSTSAQKADQAAGELGSASSKAKKPIEDVGKASEQSASRVSNLATIATRAGALIGAAFSVRAIQQYADSWSDMQSRVGAATQDMAGASDQMQRLVDIANASYSPLDQTVEVYGRNVAVLQAMGRSADEAANFTESLNHMLVLTATRGQQAASVQDALAKAMAVGRLQADGLETVLANGGEVAAALARELKTNVNNLRDFATQGKITGDVIANAVGGSLEDVRQRAALMPATIGDAFTRVNTNITQFVGQIANATGAASAVSGTVMELADVIQVLGNNIGDVLTVSLAAGGVALTRYTGGLVAATAASVTKSAQSTREAAADLAKAKATDIAAQANVREATTAVANAQATVAQATANTALLGSRASLATATGVLAAAEARLIAMQTAATASTTALATAQTAATRTSLGLLAVMTGPAGLALLAAGVAASFLLMRDGGEDAATTLDRLAASTDGLTAAQLRSNQAKAEEAVDKLRKAAEEAQGELQGMQRDYDELGKLFDRGVINATELNNVSSALNDAQANVDTANQQLAKGEGVVQRYAAALDGLTNSARAAGPALVQTGAESMRFLVSLESRALLAGITTQRGQLEALVKAGKETFAPEDLERARTAADRLDAVAAAGRSAKSALDGLNTASFGRTLELESAKVDSAMKSLNVAWNAGSVGAERFYATQIALTQQSARAQQTAIEQEIAALRKLRQAPEVVERIADAQNNLAIARIEAASDLQRLRAEEEAYFRGPVQDNIKALDEQTRTLREQNVGLQEQVDFFGLAASEITKLRAERLSEAIVQQQAALATEIGNQNRAEEVERINEVIAALFNLRTEQEKRAGLESRNERQKSEKELIDAQVKSWGDGIDTVNDMFIEGFRASLDRNGDAFKAFTQNIGKTLQNSIATAIYEATVKPVVIRFVAQLAGGLAGTDVQSGILKNAGLNTSNSNGLFGGISGGITEGAYKIGESLSKMGGNIGKVGNVIFDNAQMIGKALPWIGVGMSALSFLGEAFKGETRSGAQYGLAVNDQLYNPRRGTTVGSANGVQFLEGPSGGGSSAAVQKAIQATTDGINGLFKTVGADISLAAFWAGFEGSEKGRGGVGAGGSLSTGAMFGETGRGDNYRGTLFDPNRPNSLSAEEALNMLPAQLAQAQLQAFEAAIDQFPPLFGRMLDGVDIAGMTDEKLIELRDEFVGAAVAAEELRIGLSMLPFAPAAAHTFQFASALIDYIGSADEVAGLLSNAYQNYWTDAQRLEDITARVTEGFADINRELPTSRQMMQDWIVEAMAMGEAGAETTAALLNLGDGLDIILTASEATAEALREEAKARDESRETERLSLENKILALEGDTVELRRRELGALDPANQALQTYIWLLEDQKVITDAAAASLKATHDEIDNLAEGYNDLIDPTGKAARNQQALQAGFKGLNLVMPQTRDDFHTMLESFRQAGPQFDDVYLALLRMAPAFVDYIGGIEDSRQALVDSAAAFSQVQRDAKRSIADTVDGLRETVVLDQLATPDRQYAYYESQINALMALMPSLTSVDAIESTAQKITQLAGSAYGLLDQTGRQTVGPELLSFLDQIERMSGEAIDKQQQARDEKSAKILTDALDAKLGALLKTVESEFRQVGQATVDAMVINGRAITSISQAFAGRTQRLARGREVNGS